MYLLTYVYIGTQLRNYKASEKLVLPMYVYNNLQIFRATSFTVIKLMPWVLRSQLKTVSSTL